MRLALEGLVRIQIEHWPVIVDHWPGWLEHRADDSSIGLIILDHLFANTYLVTSWRWVDFWRMCGTSNVRLIGLLSVIWVLVLEKFFVNSSIWHLRTQEMTLAMKGATLTSLPDGSHSVMDEFSSGLGVYIRLFLFFSVGIGSSATVVIIGAVHSKAECPSSIWTSC